MNCESVNSGVVRSLLMDDVLVADGANARCGRSECSLRTERVLVADGAGARCGLTIGKSRTSNRKVANERLPA